MWTFLRQLGLSSLNLLYPSFCFHCREATEGGKMLCPSCGELLEMLPLDHNQDYAAVFAHEGPAATLLHRFTRGAEPFLAKGLGGYLLLQFHRLGWPPPDLILPVPLSNGSNPLFLLTEYLADHLQCEAKDLFTLTRGEPFLRRREACSLFRDKEILLIETLKPGNGQACAEILGPFCPKGLRILALTQMECYYAD